MKWDDCYWSAALQTICVNSEKAANLTFRAVRLDFMRGSARRTSFEKLDVNNGSFWINIDAQLRKHEKIAALAKGRPFVPFAGQATCPDYDSDEEREADELHVDAVAATRVD